MKTYSVRRAQELEEALRETLAVLKMVKSNGTRVRLETRMRLPAAIGKAEALLNSIDNIGDQT